MSANTLELPNSLHKKLEELANNGGFSVEQRNSLKRKF